MFVALLHFLCVQFLGWSVWFTWPEPSINLPSFILYLVFVLFDKHFTGIFIIEHCIHINTSPQFLIQIVYLHVRCMWILYPKHTQKRWNKQHSKYKNYLKCTWLLIASYCALSYVCRSLPLVRLFNIFFFPFSYIINIVFYTNSLNTFIVATFKHKKKYGFYCIHTILKTLNYVYKINQILNSNKLSIALWAH